FDRALDVHFDENADALAHLVAHRAIGRDGRRDRDHTVARQQLADETDAADVLVTVFFAEAQPLREVSAHQVAIQDFDLGAERAEALFQQIRNGALACARHPGEPQRESFMHGAPIHRRQSECRTPFWRLPPTTTGPPARTLPASRRECTARIRYWCTLE